VGVEGASGTDERKAKGASTGARSEGTTTNDLVSIIISIIIHGIVVVLTVDFFFVVGTRFFRSRSTIRARHRRCRRAEREVDIARDRTDCGVLPSGV